IGIIGKFKTNLLQNPAPRLLFLSRTTHKTSQIRLLDTALHPAPPVKKLHFYAGSLNHIMIK
ncbi:hypothetical protein JZU71_01720, partial [bacterium]|nr:hypothetical protein [bacterium]